MAQRQINLRSVLLCVLASFTFALLGCGNEGNKSPAPGTSQGTMRCQNGGGCAAHATCHESPAPVQCTCDDGYVGDGQTCIRCDCETGFVCQFVPPREVTCGCSAGYARDGDRCWPVEANGCGTDNGGCGDHANCIVNGSNTHLCECQPGFMGDGHSCTPITVDSCATDNGGCDAHADCIATGNGTNECNCKSGYSGNGRVCAPVTGACQAGSLPSHGSYGACTDSTGNCSELTGSGYADPKAAAAGCVTFVAYGLCDRAQTPGGCLVRCGLPTESISYLTLAVDERLARSACTSANGTWLGK